MKFKVGNKLQEIREDRKLTQAEFAELIGMSPSAFSRLERNETQADFEFISKTAEMLNVPLHEFLPDNLSFYNYHHGGAGGVVFGNLNYYSNDLSEINNLKKELEELRNELTKLKSEKNK
jgi:transcriptional regulator with XRE-family HTH domain